jgi:hypothetical protein
MPVDVEDARRRVNVPSIGLVVTGVLGLAGVAFAVFGREGMVNVYMGFFGNLGLPQDQLDEIRTQLMTTSVLDYVTNAAGVAVAVLTIVGGLRMRALRSWGLALTGAILALMPCCSSCCCVGMPFGIWALVVLMKPEVKAAFARG